MNTDYVGNSMYHDHLIFQKKFYADQIYNIIGSCHASMLEMVSNNKNYSAFHEYYINRPSNSIQYIPFLLNEAIIAYNMSININEIDNERIYLKPIFNMIRIIAAYKDIRYAVDLLHKVKFKGNLFYHVM